MALPWYEIAFGHAMAGFTVALADRAFSENAKRRTEKRIQNKMEEVTALEYLLGHSSDVVKSDREYSNNIIRARNYFEREGVSSEISTNDESHSRYISKKIKKAVNHLRRGHEKVNNLSWSKKLTAGFGIEFFFDSIEVITQSIYGVGNGIIALGRTPYQAVSFFVGMQTGKGFLYVKDTFVKSGEEKELDSIGRELTADGKLLDIVRNYSPTRDLQVKMTDAEVAETKELPTSDKESYDATQLGKRIGDSLGDAAESVGRGLSSGINTLKERINARRQAAKDEEEKRKQDLKKRYEDY
ncbi:hypothetical protein HY450_02580 [Candidatus Pacearchaeota archaeon]|nr:hypothetical protein [Candidatus Pacearchaeota archaeon]